jgi:hypothetical protein
MSSTDIAIVLAPLGVLLLGMILAFSIAFVNRDRML